MQGKHALNSIISLAACISLPNFNTRTKFHVKKKGTYMLAVRTGEGDVSM